MMQIVSSRIKQIWAKFRREERGSIALEAVILLPLLFWTYLAMFSVFHSYRTYSVNQKASYTIGDMISREQHLLSQDFVDGAQALFAFLTNASADDVAVRVTTVIYDEDANAFSLDGSGAAGFVTALNQGDVAGWTDRLPNVDDGAWMIVVETFHNYEAPFKTGLEQRQVRNFVFASPRGTPQRKWENT